MEVNGCETSNNARKTPWTDDGRGNSSYKATLGAAFSAGGYKNGHRLRSPVDAEVLTGWKKRLPILNDFRTLSVAFTKG